MALMEGKGQALFGFPGGLGQGKEGLAHGAGRCLEARREIRPCFFVPSGST